MTKKEDIRSSLGMVHVLTGDGKGKTTSALGLALRAVGRGLRVYVVQFMKGFEYGEVIAARKVWNLTIRQFGRAEFVDKRKPAKVDIEQARRALEHARKVVMSGEYDLVILDEVNVAIDFKLIALKDVIEIIKNRPKRVELVLTGRNAPKELTQLADYVSDVKEVKHPYRKGVLARKGIEF